jgi:SWI/SNF-related matrix-associated actin-dependent regulator 1 of chromatin subfamily A
MRIIDYGFEFHIFLEFDHWHKRNLEAVKGIGFTDAGGIFHQVSKYTVNTNRNTKYWIVPGPFRQMVEKLRITHLAELIVPSELKPEMTGEIAELPELTIPVALKEGIALRHYQQKGIARGLELNKFFNCDEQGLGKTIQSISTVLAANKFPCLVVCPPSMKITWRREWEKFTSKKAIILKDGILKTWPKYVEAGMAQVIIVNYQSIKKYFVEHMPQKGNGFHSKDILMRPSVDIFKSIIVDEIHKCKNKQTLVSKLTLRLAHKKEMRIGLTGTLIPNRPRELFPQLAIIGQTQVFGNEKDFLNRYCEGGSGANNLKELNFLLNKHCFFRREKKDVAKELPEKQRQKIVCEISNRAEYMKAEKDLKSYLENIGFGKESIDAKMQAEALIRMGVLKEISARGKIEAVKDFVDDIVEAGEKIVIFCNLHAIVDQLMALFPDAVRITGRENDAQKQAAIDKFQGCKTCGTNLNDHTGKNHEFVPSDTKVLIGNIKAAGVGLTLTAAWRVLFIEFPWTYADCAQCEDRTHRLGQMFTVMCTYFLGEDTIDEWSLDIIMQKKDIGNAITGGTDQMVMEVVNGSGADTNKLKLLELFTNKKSA